MSSSASTMDVDSGADESKVAFPVIKGDQLKQWVISIRNRYQLALENIHVFDKSGVALDFTIVTVPPSYHRSLTEDNDSDGELEPSDNSAYIVSYKTLIKWFHSWRDIVTGALRITPKDSIGIVQIPVDNSTIFGVFVGLAHGYLFDFDCSAPMLGEIAVYCRAHGLEALARPKIVNWIKTAQYFSDIETDSTAYNMEWDWLIVGYEFGREDIFRQAWLRLAYKVSRAKLMSYYPDNMNLLLSGIRGRILQCRSGFLQYALRDLMQHYQRANALLQPNPVPDCEVCRNGNRSCIHAQFRYIHNWLAQAFNSFNIPSPLDYNAFSGSPYDLFADSKFELSGLCDECERRGLLLRIISRLKNDIATVLGEFLTLSPDRCPMTNEDMEYIATRKKIMQTAVA